MPKVASARKGAFRDTDPLLSRLMEVRGRLVELGMDAEAETLGDVFAALELATAQSMNLPPAALLKLTFAVQHNPNCPSQWLVRLPGRRAGSIDLKPYGVTGSGLGLIPHETKDILGFGKSFSEAGNAAIEAQNAAIAHQKAGSP